VFQSFGGMCSVRPIKNRDKLFSRGFIVGLTRRNEAFVVAGRFY
jgi:hypothetical protein